MAGAGALYRDAGVALIRATTDPGGLELPEDLDLFGDDVVECGCAWLARIWARAEVREALGVASPVLSRQVDQVLAGRRPDAAETRRTALSVASYLLRWQGRATPFGLFAGVSIAGFGTEPKMCWGQGRRVVARADSTWSGLLVDRLERRPDVLERLLVVADGSAFARGNRVVIPGFSSDERPGRFAPLEVSVRLTGAVRAALEAARQPMRFSELIHRLAAGYAGAPARQIEEMLAGLVAQGFLITALRVPMTASDTLAHVVAQLEAIGAEKLPGARDLMTQLQAIREELALSGAAVGEIAAGEVRAGVAGRMTAVCDVVEQPLVLDMALDGEFTLPHVVIDEAQAAAGALLRLTPYPFGTPPWKQFHARFRARYGIGAIVPVNDLVQADSGLGMPAGYLGAPIGRAARTLTTRDEALLGLVQQTLLDGREEIVANETVISTLTVGEPAEMILPARVELAFQIHAASLDAMASGAFRLAVTGVPRPSSSMVGRFAHLLPEVGRARLAASYAVLSSDDPDTFAAQLSFPPRRRRSENVVRAQQLLPRVISLGEYREPSDEVIELRDLAVCADARQLYLVDLRTGGRVEPRVVHALEAGAQTPPLARFLAEITTARAAVYKAFDWGAARRLPYLPRVRAGRSILTPARWLLSCEELPAPAAGMAAWESALDLWRGRLRAPETVLLCEGDQRLPLDLSHRVHRALLRSRLDRVRHVELREGPAASDLAWAGRAHEFLVPMQLARPRHAEHPPRTVSAVRTIPRTSAVLPGRSSYLYARIHGHPHRQDEILTEYLPALFEGWEDPPQLWWFRRHRAMTRPDEEQHLRLYLRLPGPDRYGTAAGRVGDWASDLRARALLSHLELGTYQSETGRYGHTEAMSAAEEVFAADSVCALAHMKMAARTGTSLQALATAGLLELALSYVNPPGEGADWLIRHLPQEHGKLDRQLRDAALLLADPRQQWAALRAIDGGQDIVEAWERRCGTLADYRLRLTNERNPYPVLRSLLHLHHVRTLGVDPERERVTYRLVRAAALRQAALNGRGTA